MYLKRQNSAVLPPERANFALSANAIRKSHLFSGHYFTVLDRNENEIVMGMDDVHLSFRVSVLKKKREQGNGVFLTSIVKFHNTAGKVYFSTIKPFHQAIMASMLEQAKANQEK